MVAGTLLFAVALVTLAGLGGVPDVPAGDDIGPATETPGEQPGAQGTEANPTADTSTPTAVSTPTPEQATPTPEPDPATATPTETDDGIIVIGG